MEVKGKVVQIIPEKKLDKYIVDFEIIKGKDYLLIDTMGSSKWDLKTWFKNRQKNGFKVVCVDDSSLFDVGCIVSLHAEPLKSNYQFVMKK